MSWGKIIGRLGGQSKKYILFSIRELGSKATKVCVCVHRAPFGQAGKFGGKKKSGIFFKQLPRRVLKSDVT